MVEPGEIRADRWGIADEYWDVAEQRHVTSPTTRAELQRAMGVGPEAPAPPDAVRLAWVGQTRPLAEPAVIRLEDGTDLGVCEAIPGDLPVGYHELQPLSGQAPLLLIVAPPTCYLPDPLHVWGWALQLYACRSAESWGMGDLGDLRSLAAWSRHLGAGVLLTNPIGATAPVQPQQASPYYPASRRFRNPLYIRVAEVPGAERLGPELTRLDELGRALNADRHIDRDAVFSLKMRALNGIWAQLGEVPELERFWGEQGQALSVFGAYCALAEKFGQDWRVWPAGYERPDAAGVQAFVRDNQPRVRFHAWLQWLLDEQLRRACTELPVLLDLPVGIDIAGPDGWQWQDCLAQGARVGAPPDYFSPDGQDWGVTPFVPHCLRAAHYRPFIETLRASFRHAGGLRIDHVMGLFELFWLPAGLSAREGAYVQYRAEELLAIVCIESERARALVVGEDLGTVHPRVRHKMAQTHMLSYKLMFFEAERPSHYPHKAVAAASSHDLPTLAGLWTGLDLEDCRRAGVHANSHAEGEVRRRLSKFTGLPASAPSTQVISEIYRVLAQSPCAVVLAQLEDVLAVHERPNIPGARADWPNWSLALPESIEALQASPAARDMASVLGQRRAHVQAET